MFSHSPKEVLEVVNLAKTLETTGLKLLLNTKTHWTSMLSPLKHVLKEYKSFLVKMHMDAPINKLVVENLDLLCDLELVFGLSCMLPMLEVVHKLIEYVKKRDVFIIDFFSMDKSIKVDVYWLYVEPFYKYEDFFFLFHCYL
jgi:hypothetical protein